VRLGVSVYYPSGYRGWFKERAARRRAGRDGATAAQARAAAEASSPLARSLHESAEGSL